jgi:hypothetical protein
MGTSPDVATVIGSPVASSELVASPALGVALSGAIAVSGGPSLPARGAKGVASDPDSLQPTAATRMTDATAKH